MEHIVTGHISSGLLAYAGTNSGPDSGDPDAFDRRSDCIFTASIRGYTVLDEPNLIIGALGRHNSA